MTYKLKQRLHYARKFEGSTNLFLACWKDLQKSIRNGHTYNNDEEVQQQLDCYASRRVNNSASPFYMRG